MVRNIFFVYIITASLLLLGCLLPWASMFGISVSGSDTDDGKLVLFAILFVILAAVLAYRVQLLAARVVGFFASAIALFVGIYDADKLDSRSISIGIGLWFVIIAGIIGVVGSFIPNRGRSRV